MKITASSPSARVRVNTPRRASGLRDSSTASAAAAIKDQKMTPAGFTGQDLRNAAVDAGVAVSPTKFTQIVRAAGLGPLPHGGAGSHYRFTNAEIRDLAHAALHGGRDVHRPRRFRHGPELAAIWLRLAGAAPDPNS